MRSATRSVARFVFRWLAALTADLSFLKGILEGN
jgi:hypothetical protein